MARTIECPKCGADISDSHQGAEPDVGIMGGGWYCDACDLAVSDEDDYEPHDDDVQLFGTRTSIDEGNGICRHCRTPLQLGYGLAGGGGIGPYTYCPNERCTDPTLNKYQDPEMT